ncbi:MAG: uroporphyrinogen-III synthase [Rhizobiales bacterium]|nr:uroporphyrinogen-III synthase [Hyphomicrobiales bacterium]
MHLLMTRPEPDSTLSAEKLRAKGYSVLINPVLETQFSKEPVPWRRGADFVVTSRNGMRALNALASDEMRREARLFSVGDATADLAEAAGFTMVLSASGAVEDLVDTVLEEQPARLVYVCGRDRKGNLETRLRANGIVVDMAERYRAEFARTFQPAAISAFQVGALDGVLLYSRRTAEAFASLMEHHSLSYSTKKIAFFCLAKTVASVFDGVAGIDLCVAERSDERSLFEKVDAYFGR